MDKAFSVYDIKGFGEAYAKFAENFVQNSFIYNYILSKVPAKHLKGEIRYSGTDFEEMSVDYIKKRSEYKKNTDIW